MRSRVDVEKEAYHVNPALEKDTNSGQPSSPDETRSAATSASTAATAADGAVADAIGPGLILALSWAGPWP